MFIFFSSPEDNFQSLLLMLVIAFTPDFLDLENRADCEKAQMRHVQLLHRYLRGKLGRDRARQKLAQGLMVTSYAREAAEIQNGMQRKAEISSY